MYDLRTKYPPKKKALMVYDGNCGFCKYWLVKWKKISAEQIDYEPFQTAAQRFDDIPLQEFQNAVQLILTNGEVYSGAKAAYFTYTINKKLPFLFRAYLKISAFRWISDRIYRLIAQNRNRAFLLTKVLFGPDPSKNSSLRVLLIISLLILSLILLIQNT
jgi:predicted DCC family thiol-disulfide oxidoreductase YuxK